MLKHLKSKHRIGLETSPRLERLCKKILAVLVGRVAIKPLVPHQSCQQSISASDIQERSTFDPQALDDSFEQLAVSNIPGYKSRIGISDRLLIGFLQPIRRLGLKHATVLAIEVPDLVLSQDRLRKNVLHRIVGDRASDLIFLCHRCSLDDSVSDDCVSQRNLLPTRKSSLFAGLRVPGNSAD